MIFGTLYFGRIHKTRAGCHVATQCFHVLGIPIIPMQSYVFQRRFDGGKDSVPVPLQVLSFVVGMLRILSIYATAITSLMMPVAIADLGGHPPLFESRVTPYVIAAAWIASLAAILLLYGFKRFRKADTARERWIHEQLGLTTKAPAAPTPLVPS